jgi:ribonuclease BN (tRNA processing enzyme)/DNA-binding response OmpR family regulator
MRARFYGTRGSIPTPGPSTLRYGGNTSCTLVLSNADTLVLLDIGTGAAVLGRELVSRGEKMRGHILISHTHWDHIQGLPFFEPLFVAGNEWDIYAPRGLRENLRETLAGQMQYTYFPVELEQLGATIRFHELVEGDFRIGDIEVATQYLNHPTLTLGYRLECDGAVIVYACDHEPHLRTLATGKGDFVGQDSKHAAFLKDADLVIHDAQYLAREYPSKVGWGHSTVEYAVAVASIAGAKRLALTHHDPRRTDAEIDAEITRLRMQSDPSQPDIVAAAEGTEIEVAGDIAKGEERRQSARSDVGAALIQNRILLITAPEKARMLEAALNPDRIEIVRSNLADSVDDAARVRPTVIVVEDRNGMDLYEIASSLRVAAGAPLSLLLITEHEARAAQSAAQFDDCLINPISPSYARARLRAALLRRASRWQRAEKPREERHRLATLKRLNILDTPREERFDRITRLAAGAFNVPVALITLIDSERQWCKSGIGTDIVESPRDESFCAHAILGKGPMIVEDALADDRFADNPMVTGPPRIRFYAGYPLVLADGTCVGTVCILDTRPRVLNEREIAVLKEFARLAVAELEHM